MARGCGKSEDSFLSRKRNKGPYQRTIPKDHTKGPYKRGQTALNVPAGEDGLTWTFESWFSIDISDDTIVMLIRGA